MIVPTSFEPLAFDQDGATMLVELVNPVGGVSAYTHLDGDTVIDIQATGVMIDYGGIRWLVPWTNIRCIRQALPS